MVGTRFKRRTRLKKRKKVSFTIDQFEALRISVLSRWKLFLLPLKE